MAEQEGAGASLPPPLPPPIDGVEQRLDHILAELRAIRAQGEATVTDNGTVELREPATRRGKQQRGG